jgi:membrane protein CcdC involved in cytochrome C biogenesis
MEHGILSSSDLSEIYFIALITSVVLVKPSTSDFPSLTAIIEASNAAPLLLLAGLALRYRHNPATAVHAYGYLGW